MTYKGMESCSGSKYECGCEECVRNIGSSEKVIVNCRFDGVRRKSFCAGDNR